MKVSPPFKRQAKNKKSKRWFMTLSKYYFRMLKLRLLTKCTVNSPVKATCPQCYVEITTFVRHEMNPFFPLSVVATLLIFGMLSLIICPVAYLLTQNAVHRCSRCLVRMGEKKCFGFPDDFGAPVSSIFLVMP